MKNKLAAIFGLFLLLLLCGPLACIEECGPFPNKLRVVGFDWFTYSATYSGASEKGLILRELENDSVVFDSYSIMIVPKKEAYFAQNSKNWTFNFIQSAFACSPLMPSTDEKVDRIVIKSETDFDRNHPAGTDLAELFDIVILDYENKIYHQKYTLIDYLSLAPTVPDEMILILREQPDLTSAFIFFVEYHQQGTTRYDLFEFKTSRVVLRR